MFYEKDCANDYLKNKHDDYGGKACVNGIIWNFVKHE
jgi:hypothetical protein